MSSIDVTTALPKRLVFSDGQWSLEVTRWHAIDRDVFNPISSYISGTESSLKYLHDLDLEPAVLNQARDILMGMGEPGTSYELTEKQWVLQTQFVDVPTAAPVPAAGGSSEMQQVLQHLEGMEERLGFLERQIAGRLPGNDPAPSVRPVPDEEIPHSSAG